jgi:hypothetical protein
MPDRIAPDKRRAEWLLRYCERQTVDLVAVRQFAADAADGKHGFPELARRGQTLFPEGALITDHAEVFKSFPKAEGDGHVVYTLWNAVGEKEQSRIRLRIDPQDGRIVSLSALHSSGN